MTELSIDLNGRRLTALQWGAQDGKPLLALHGWLDNAASFEQLAPLLEGYHVVALDFAGQGHSQWRSADAGYNIWDDLPDIEALLEALGWDRFALLGHSRGAVVASLYAGVRPQRVTALCLLDGVSVSTVELNAMPEQLARWLDDRRHLSSIKRRTFTTPEQALQARGSSAEQLGIVRRNLQESDGGWCWSTDPRVQGASAVKWSKQHVEAIYSRLTQPRLLIVAEQGHLYEAFNDARLPDLPGFTIERCAGGHHLHLEAPVEPLAGLLNDFFSASADLGNTGTGSMD